MDALQTQTDCLLAYQSVRDNSLQLIAPLSAEDCGLQAAPFVSPAKWHLAHTTWFFETFILLKHAPSYQAYNAQFQVLFNSYYNGIGEQFPRPQRHLLSRPSLDEILAYRRYVDEAMHTFLLDGAESSLEDLVILGINHEQQHQELLLMDLKYSFYQNTTYPAYNSKQIAPDDQTITPLKYHGFNGGLFEVGASGRGFHFDNEEPAHQTYLTDFACADRLITNGEFLQFIEDGGYSNAHLWLSDGWAWVNQSQAKQPLYWIKQQGQWMEFGLNGLKPMNPYAPVIHVNFYEAYAYAQWADARLLNEFEWEVAAAHGGGLSQMMNVAWQWTQSSYQPYPGFKAPQGAVGEYNGKFMYNQMVLRGGCELTPTHHARVTYRNFFYPQDQWPMTGIRLAKDVL